MLLKKEFVVVFLNEIQFYVGSSPSLGTQECKLGRRGKSRRLLYIGVDIVPEVLAASCCSNGSDPVNPVGLRSEDDKAAKSNDSNDKG